MCLIKSVRAQLFFIISKSLFTISLKGALRRWKRAQHAHVLRVHGAVSPVSALRCIPWSRSWTGS